MIKIEQVKVFGWDAAIRGMRNPLNSWDKSDSYEEYIGYVIGDTDLALMKRLVASGSDHAKFLRMINVTLDITAPLYWWKEFDTYKVGTVANSCSTMHTLSKKEFTMDDFSHEHLFDEYVTAGCEYHHLLSCIVDALNEARTEFIETENKLYWWQMIQLLPSSYNQKRTVQLNYGVLRAMYMARKTHKLDEWIDFCDWAEGLPYFSAICLGELK